MENQDDIGKTALFKDLSDEKYELFLKLLSFENNEFLEVLSKMTDKNTLLKLLDVFSGEYIRFPNRKSVIWVLEKVNIYTYLKNKNFSDESYYTVSKEYDRTIYEIKKIVNVIEKNLNKWGSFYIFKWGIIWIQ